MFGKINAAIVGTGNIAGKMADTLKYVRGVRKYAVISRDADRARNFAASKGFKKSYGSLDEALEDKKIDFVYIATPHTSHYETAKKCLEHGKNVLCEKPMTINSKQAQELFEIAKEKELLITEAMWTRFTPFAEKVRQEVRGKAIGEPVYLTANEGANIRSVERMTNPTLGGGSLLDLGIYAVNAALMFFGNDVLSITPVCTYTDTGVDEQDSITIKYKNGRMAQLSASMVGVCDQQIRIYGTRGYMVIEGTDNFASLSIYGKDGEKLSYFKRPKQRTGYEYEVEEFVKAIQSGWNECPNMTHDATLELIGMMDTIRAQLGIKYPGEPGYTAPKIAITSTAKELMTDALEGSEHGKNAKSGQESDTNPDSGARDEKTQETADSAKTSDTPNAVKTPEAADADNAAEPAAETDSAVTADGSAKTESSGTDDAANAPESSDADTLSDASKTDEANAAAEPAENTDKN